MPLRRSPVLTPAALAARRANTLKSTGPRTERGKAWSCLNALRHGRRARCDLRSKIERTGDWEALYLFDLIHEAILKEWNYPRLWTWRINLRLAVQAWCLLKGCSQRPRVKVAIRTKLERPYKSVTYAESLKCARRVIVIDRQGWGLMFVNPAPSRRRRVNMAWVPEVIPLDGKPLRVRRARRRPQVEALWAIPQETAGQGWDEQARGPSHDLVGPGLSRGAVGPGPVPAWAWPPIADAKVADPRVGTSNRMEAHLEAQGL